jgi:hypothetical protein
MMLEQDEQPGRQWFGSFSQSEKPDELPGGCGRLVAACDSRLRAYTADGELGTAGLLATKEVAHRLDCGVLVVQVWFKVQFHSWVSQRDGRYGDDVAKTISIVETSTG